MNNLNNIIGAPQFTIKELFESCQNAQNMLCDMNLNGIWPDSNPNWDENYYSDPEESKNEAKVLINYLEKKWTLSDVKYNGELILVKLSNDFRLECVNSITDNNSRKEIPYYLEENALFYVVGEIVQKPDHYIISCTERGILVGDTHGFHGYELEIIMPHNEENGETVTINHNWKSNELEKS